VSGSDQPRLADVARLAGVSRSTASLAFSGAGPVAGETRSRVLAAAAELGYSGPDPRARSLRQGRSGVVGIVFDETMLSAFRDPVNVATLDGIASGLGNESNGLLLLTETGAVGSGIGSAAIDAAVLMGCSPVFDRVLLELGRRGIPVVSIEGGAPAAGEPRPATGPASAARVDIALDNTEASEALARHLHGLGHRHVGTLTLATDPERVTGLLTAEREASITTTVTADRLRGVRRVFPEAIAASSGFNSVKQAVVAARLLLDEAGGRITAVLAQSDLLAVGVLQAAAERGLRVPDDLSVTGFDGIRIEGLTGHDLTTMVQPAAEKGREAGRAVRALLAGDPVESVVFSCELHLGDTTGPPSSAR
jgi:DNA-binding LacI/PurR family transcriptional regulator